MTAVLQSKQNEQQPDELFAFTHGIPQDKRLAQQEVSVQKAWLRGLHQLGVVTEAEVASVEATLDEAQTLIETDKFEWSIRDEDIHMHLERFITERLGDIGKRMHLGRSRNDLIATTLHLYVADTVTQMDTLLDGVITSLEEQAVKTHNIIVPGMTHLQHGQPVRFAHIMRAYIEMFKRDKIRLAQAKEGALANMPLGAAALAGTPLTFDLDVMAQDLGFKAPLLNSYDAVGDRDFMLEALSAFALVAVHLARLAEDCIYWSATPVGLLQLPKRWSTGSSIMPNKRNPDVPELTRGKAAHIIAAQNDGHVLVRTVPTSYGSDLHELKQVYMRSLDELAACLKVWPGFLGEMEVDAVRAKELCNTGHILATEIADALVDEGVPFRNAYKAVAALVPLADSKGLQVHELQLEDVNATLKNLELPEMHTYDFTFEKAIARRKNSGGTA